MASETAIAARACVLLPLEVLFLDQHLVFSLDEFCVTLLVHRALRLDVLVALCAEVKLSWVAGVIALDVEHRFIHETERDFSGNRFALVVLRRDG